MKNMIFYFFIVSILLFGSNTFSYCQTKLASGSQVQQTKSVKDVKVFDSGILPMSWSIYVDQKKAIIKMGAENLVFDIKSSGMIDFNGNNYESLWFKPKGEVDSPQLVKIDKYNWLLLMKSTNGDRVVMSFTF